MALTKELKTYLQKIQEHNDKQFNELKIEIRSLKDIIEKGKQDKNIDELKEEIATLQKENKKITEKLEEIEDDVYRSRCLEEGHFSELKAFADSADLQISRVEMIIYNNCIKIGNIPEDDDRNANELFYKLLEVMDCKAKDFEFRNIFRRREDNVYYNHNRKRNIVVEFVNTDVRINFVKRFKECSSSKPITQQLIGFYSTTFDNVITVQTYEMLQM